VSLYSSWLPGLEGQGARVPARLTVLSSPAPARHASRPPQCAGMRRAGTGLPFTWPDGRTPTVRDMLLDMIEEYARHTGHADVLREAVDGRVGEGAPEDCTF
jgi:hypothetical protein